jgi:hypothetical protein
MPIFSSGLRRHLRREAVTLKASGAETTSTTGPALELGDARALSFVVAVTAASGTSPTLSVVIEGSDDGTNWHTLATVGSNGYAVGSVGSTPSNFTGAATVRGTCPAARYVRYRSVIGGSSPSFTFSVTGSAA